jgi:3',5'-cyclic AMP phosphodiesterase CpdA
MLIAHISDLHVLDLHGVPLRRFANKRLTGLVNLWTARRHSHPLEIFDALVETLRTGPFEHVVVTGDLTNLSLETEFARARAGIERIGGPERVTLVPGNHDIYTPDAKRNALFERAFAPWIGPTFPFCKRVGEVALIGMNSAFPTAPVLSYGAIGKRQRQAMVELARSERCRDAFKVVLLHHNLHARTQRIKDLSSRLMDRRAFLAALAEADADLVLHGHTHKANRFVSERGGHSIPIFGCGSSTWSDRHNPARFNVYAIEHGALTSAHRHVLDLETGRFERDPEPLTLAG